MRRQNWGNKWHREKAVKFSKKKGREKPWDIRVVESGETCIFCDQLFSWVLQLYLTAGLIAQELRAFSLYESLGAFSHLGFQQPSERTCPLEMSGGQSFWRRWEEKIYLDWIQ